MSYLLQYDENMTEGKENNNKIVARDKCKVNASFPLLKLLKANGCDPLLHMNHKKIKAVETDNIIH